MKKLSEQLSDLSDRAKRTADVVDTAKANAIVARADADDLETT